MAAIRSFFRYASFSEPASADLCRRVLAIPSKRYERRPIEYLTREEIDALLAARHTAAMQLLQRGVDRSVIALWMGHESVDTTQMYYAHVLNQNSWAIQSPADEM